MITTVFPIQYYEPSSDLLATRYYEILHTIGMTIRTMANDIASPDFAEKHLHLGVPRTQTRKKNQRQGPTRDDTDTATGLKAYRRVLQTSEELLPADHTIQSWEKVVLRTCSFTLLLCMFEDYEQTARVLDSVFLNGDDWTYFANQRHVQSSVASMCKSCFYTLLHQTCKTLSPDLQPQTWIRSNLANWVEVCGKNLSAFLQTNQVPGGAFENSQRSVCIASTGHPLHRYIGSIHLLSKHQNPAYLVMGILKHPVAERDCNQTDQYTGFVRTILGGVQNFMVRRRKSTMWTFPLGGMATILRRMYGDFDQPRNTQIANDFLVDIGVSCLDRYRILRHPSGLFVQEHHQNTIAVEAYSDPQECIKQRRRERPRFIRPILDRPTCARRLF